MKRKTERERDHAVPETCGGVSQLSAVPVCIVLICLPRLCSGTPEHGTSTVGASGTGSMSVTEEESTYAMFMVMAAPPMLGCDIRKLAPHTLKYLTNPELLAINQVNESSFTICRLGGHTTIDFVYFVLAGQMGCTSVACGHGRWVAHLCETTERWLLCAGSP